MNWYTSHFPFPYRGLKYVRKILVSLNLYNKTYKKKIHNSLYINVTPSDHIQEQIFWYGYYEKEAILIWQKLINPDSVIIDIGANIGYYSLIGAFAARNGKVFSFEPVSLLREKLTKNCKTNKLDNITIEPFALGNQKGRCQIYISANDNIGMSGLRPQENFSGTTEEVDMISFDEWADNNNLDHINIIKIDAEGAELNILQGMINTLKKNQPAILLEAINDLLAMFGHTVTDIYTLLSQMHYTAYEILDGSTIKNAYFGQESYSILFLPNDFKIPSTIRFL